jgi:Xaa-Pro aminopeptidase
MKNKRTILLSKLMASKKLDAIILTTLNDTGFNDNIYYYTGFKGYAVFFCRRKPLKISLVVSAIELEKAKKTGANAVLIKKDTRLQTLKKIIGSSKRIGIDKRTMLVSQHEELKKATKGMKIKFVDVSKELVNIRAVKEEKEIKSVKMACAVCDGIFSKITKDFKFKTEKELANFIVKNITESGLEKSFNPIVSSGKNSSDVHHNPSGKIEKGFLILDFGCEVNGYCSDMTRTLYVGKPSEKEKELYKKVLDVQEKTLSLATVGKKCSVLDRFAREKLGEKFIHNLGHGVGLEIHEQPNLTSVSKDILKENMIVTIEPGIYEEGKYGIRIEDTVLITKKGPVRLTKSSKNFICIDN